MHNIFAHESTNLLAVFFEYAQTTTNKQVAGYTRLEGCPTQTNIKIMYIFLKKKTPKTQNPKPKPKPTSTSTSTPQLP